MRALDAAWYGDGAWPVAARAMLAPLGSLYGAVMRARNAWYDGAASRALAPAVPALSVGNLSIGGTGKTPMAAWCARELSARGGRPAIVLRGYGDDEPAVHRQLNPAVPVVVAADRVAGTATARAAGADCVVLDDAFQHRRVRRAADVVLVSADRWPPGGGVFPAGPWREPIAGLRRATLLVVTRKAATAARADGIAARLREAAPGVPVAVVHLAPGPLMPATPSPDETVGATPPMHGPTPQLAGAEVLAISGIGDPEAFAAQLRGAGARVRPRAFPDHHAYTAGDVASLVRAVPAGGLAVTTLKDVVKLAGRWPAAAPRLWYVSQRVVVEAGGDALSAALEAVLAAREAASPT